MYTFFGLAKWHQWRIFICRQHILCIWCCCQFFFALLLVGCPLPALQCGNISWNDYVFVSSFSHFTFAVRSLCLFQFSFHSRKMCAHTRVRARKSTSRERYLYGSILLAHKKMKCHKIRDEKWCCRYCDGCAVLCCTARKRCGTFFSCIQNPNSD